MRKLLTLAASIWVTDAGGIDFPQVTRVARIRRDHYDTDGHLVGKEIIHAVTSLDAKKADAEALARIARGQWGIESVHWVRDTAWTKTQIPDTPETVPRPWPRCVTSPLACSTSTG